MKVSEIVTRVRSAIDEVVQGDSQLLANSEDVENLTGIIVDKIPYAFVHVIENAPISKLDSTAFEKMTAQELNAGFSITSDLVGMVRVPDNVLRIIEARLSSWSQSPVPSNASSPVATMQLDKYARGSFDRPVIIDRWHGGNRYLEMYCAQSQADELNFTFVRKPDLTVTPDDMNKDVAIPAQLEASLIYQVAALTMTAFREEIASSLFAIAQKYLDGYVTPPTTE